MSDLNGKTIENWVASECPDIQDVINTALIAARQGAIAEKWTCPKSDKGCVVKVGLERAMFRRFRARLIDPEHCVNIPPIPDSE